MVIERPNGYSAVREGSWEHGDLYRNFSINKWVDVPKDWVGHSIVDTQRCARLGLPELPELPELPNPINHADAGTW
jgi:hypothetical protein